MAGFLAGLAPGLGTLFGGAGNAGAASSNAWNYGQYSPFTVNNPMGTTSWNGTSGTSTLSPLQTQLQGAFGNSVLNGLGAQYHPYDTSGLNNTYQNLYGGNNFQNGVNNTFNQSVNGIMPFMQQANASNLDNEFSKGTLASTAGSYQTAGFNQGLGATLSGLYGQAYQNQLASSGQQWNAALGQAGLGEQQAEFAPQFGLSQEQAGVSGLNQQNGQVLNQMQLAGNLGAQRSGANVAAATPGIGTGETQDQATAGLLSGLLFGGGVGGNLLSSLLGTNGGHGIAGLAGKGLSALGGLFGGNNSSAGGGSIFDQLSNQGYGGYSPPGFDQNAGGGSNLGDNINLTDEGQNWWGDSGFSPASGEAANGLQNLGVDNIEESSQARNSLADVYNGASGNQNGFGSLLGTAGGALSAYQGLTSGTAQGEAGGALTAAQLAAKNNVFGSSSGAVGAGATQGMNALGIYSGIKQGGAMGYAQAANSAYGLATGTAGIPGVGQALSIYNAVEGYQSGDTAGDAIRGAEAGASIGSVVPVVGTIIGGLIGGAVGAISSAFGSGKVDAENAPFESYTQAYNKAGGNASQLAASVQNPYTELAGMFDLRKQQIKGNIPIYNTYGRMGEQRFTSDLVNVVNQAKAANPTASPTDIFSKNVQPWLDSMGSWNDSNKNAMMDLIKNMTGQIASGTYKQNFKAIGGQQVFTNG